MKNPKNMRVYSRAYTIEEQHALERSYEKAYPIVSSFVATMGGQSADAKDLLQDAMMVYILRDEQEAAMCAAPTVSYLAAVARNIWYKKCRRVSERLVFGKKRLPEGIQMPSLPGQSDGNERIRLFDEVIKCLDGDSRQILVYFYVDRLGMEEIARLMGYASAQVVKNKKKRAVDALRKLFQNSQTEQYEPVSRSGT